PYSHTYYISDVSQTFSFSTSSNISYIRCTYSYLGLPFNNYKAYYINHDHGGSCYTSPPLPVSRKSPYVGSEEKIFLYNGLTSSSFRVESTGYDSYLVYDYVGRLVKKGAIVDGVMYLDLSDIRGGFLIFKAVSKSGEVYVKKIIK